MNKTTQTVESAAAVGAFHIEDVYPLIDGGRFAVKRIVGEPIEIWADVYRDGHDVVAAALLWRRERDREWRREPMTHHGNDRWVGSFVPDQLGHHVYAIEAWTDEFATWRHGFELKQKAGADLTLDAIEGAGMLTKAQAGGQAAATVILKQCEDFLQTGDILPAHRRTEDAVAESSCGDLTRSQLFPLVMLDGRGRIWHWYRSCRADRFRAALFKDSCAIADIAPMGLTCLSTPIHDRPHQPQGAQQRGGFNRRRSRKPLRDRRRRRRPRCGASGIGHVGGFP